MKRVVNDENIFIKDKIISTKFSKKKTNNGNKMANSTMYIS